VKQGPGFTASRISRGIASLAGVSRSSVRLFWRYPAALPVPLICPLRRRRMRPDQSSKRRMHLSSRKCALHVEYPVDPGDRVLDPQGFGCVVLDHSEIKTWCAFPCRLLPEADARFGAFASQTISVRFQVLMPTGSRTRDWFIPEGSRASFLLWIASTRPSNRCGVSNSPPLGSASAGQGSNHNPAAFVPEFCSSIVKCQASAVAL